LAKLENVVKGIEMSERTKTLYSKYTTKKMLNNGGYLKELPVDKFVTFPSWKTWKQFSPKS